MNNHSPLTVSPPPYIGRFAPSPSGPLHLGSLVAALASYLDARAHDGTWLLRMEDVDPPREPAGAADHILTTMDVYGLHWDGKVLYQSERSDAYEAALEALHQQGRLYGCTCTRKQLAGFEGRYPGLCRHQTTLPNEPHSLRFISDNSRLLFEDRIQGEQAFDVAQLGDCVLKRKDGLYGYQLAVTVDDAYQGITHVVRGIDLLDSTPWQLQLLQSYGAPQPVYAHIPVVTLDNGNKLSKQNHAPGISLSHVTPTLIQALKALGINVPIEAHKENPEVLLHWAVGQWNIQRLGGLQFIAHDAL